MTDAIYLFQAAALFVVIVRMAARRLDRNHRREFVLLLGWLAYCFAAMFVNRDWVHLSAWALALPSLWRASRNCSWWNVALCLCAAAAISFPVFMAWGGQVYVACMWFGVSAGTVLYSSALRDGDAVKALIGAQFAYYFGALILLAAMGLAAFAPVLALVSGAVWIAMALAIGPQQGEASRETDLAMRWQEFLLAVERLRLGEAA